MEEEVRVCRKCGVERPISNFGKYKSKNGELFRYVCKICINIRTGEIRKLDPEKYLAKSRNSHKIYKTKEKESLKKYRQKNKDKISKKTKEWRKRNPEKIKMYGRKEYAKKRNNAKFRINSSISSLVRYSLNMHKGSKKGMRWEVLVGYTVDDLRMHLEKQFTDGMSWDNYGEWWIDHIIPQSAFNFSDASHIDFQRCWALSNLRPLWKIENLIKKDKLYQPFQPSLAF